MQCKIKIGSADSSAESDQRCGMPQTAWNAANVKRVRNLVIADHRLTILRDDLNMN